MDADDTRVKLLMSWDIRPGKDADYFEFAVREFGPALVNLGMPPSEAWFNVYGEGPQMLGGVIAPDIEAMQKILASEEWLNLKKKLLEFVINYREQIVKPEGNLQLF